MATEEQLKDARRSHAQKLADVEEIPFPQTTLIGQKENELRKEFLSLAQDDQKRSVLPHEDGASPSDERQVLFGRLMAKRGPFLVIRTPLGDGQALVRKDDLPENQATELKTADLADFVFVAGPPIQTKTGAAAIKAFEYKHLGKALLPPPAKWHGLKDVEKRYRERYVDLFANPEVAKVFKARSIIVQTLRAFLDGQDFLEVETPLLHSVRGGATAKSFSTHHNTLDLSLFLRIAPELYLKRLLVGGFERVYELGRCFRNEGISTRHNPEFSILELYMAYTNYEYLMELTEKMLRFVDEAVLKQLPEFGEGRAFDLSNPWPRVTMKESIVHRIEQSGKADIQKTPWDSFINAECLNSKQKLEEVCEKVFPALSKDQQKALKKSNTHGKKIFFLYECLVEPDLPMLYRNNEGTKSVPVFITEYPVEVSPLARKNDQNPEWVDRFELFVEGRELANAFNELNDPDDQAQRFEGQLENRASGDEEAMDFDADYIRALSHGMPPAAGFGIGVDRLVMLLCNQPSIRDVLLFPLLRPPSTKLEAK